MNRKMLSKLAIDLVMVVLMLTALASPLTGNTIHEILGVSMLGLFFVHNILNWRWYKTALKGKPNVLRVLQIAVNLLLLAAMLVLMVSAVPISYTVFAFINVNGGLIARKLHILAAYWGFILMSVHLGMHWGMVMGAVHKMTRITNTNHIRTMVLRIMTVLIAACGVYASFDRDVGSKLILYYTYSYWNFDESAMFFFTDYLAIMGIYICVTYYMLKFVNKFSRNP